MKRVKDSVIRKNLFHRLILTNRCRLCGKVIAIKGTLCENCDPEKQRIDKKALLLHTYCVKDFDRHTSPFYFDGDVRTGIHNLKYSGYKMYSEFFADEMVKVIERDFSDEKVDFFTCVPITKRKKYIKGYNQCDFLIKLISKAFGEKATPNLLVKIKETPNQVSLSRKERLTNLRGAFKVNEKYDVKGKTILLCDDVVTTGSTLSECAKTLRKAGAKKVISVTASMKDEIF